MKRRDERVDGIVCDAGISKNGIGGKKVRIKVFDLSKKKEIFSKEYEKKSDNNLAELEAIYEAAKIAHFRQEIFTDSLTAIRTTRTKNYVILG